MKKCPRCTDAPNWHWATNTTRKRADGFRYFLFTGCSHAMELAKLWGLVRHDQLLEHEVKWEAAAVKMFDEMTAAWTEPQRVSFRVRLLWITPARELNLAPASPPPPPRPTSRSVLPPENPDLF